MTVHDRARHLARWALGTQLGLLPAFVLSRWLGAPGLLSLALLGAFAVVPPALAVLAASEARRALEDHAADGAEIGRTLCLARVVGYAHGGVFIYGILSITSLLGVVSDLLSPPT